MYIATYPVGIFPKMSVLYLSLNFISVDISVPAITYDKQLTLNVEGATT